MNSIAGITVGLALGLVLIYPVHAVLLFNCAVALFLLRGEI